MVLALLALLVAVVLLDDLLVDFHVLFYIILLFLFYNSNFIKIIVEFGLENNIQSDKNKSILLRFSHNSLSYPLS